MFFVNFYNLASVIAGNSRCSYNIITILEPDETGIYQQRLPSIFMKFCLIVEFDSFGSCCHLTYVAPRLPSTGRISENNNGSSASDGNGYEYVSSAQSESSREGLPTPASLAELLSTTRQMLNQQAEECLLVCCLLNCFAESYVSIKDNVVSSVITPLIP